MKKNDYLIKVSEGENIFVHIRNIGGSDHVTMCGLDGDDPSIGLKTYELKRGDKMDCGMCRVYYDNRRGLSINKSWVKN